MTTLNHSVDLLLVPRWIIPIEPVNTVLEHHVVAIKHGRIDAIAPCEAAKNIRAKQTLHLPQHAVLPGLINAHSHLAMSLLRGYADDLPLMDWLSQHIWPAEAKFVNADFIRDGGTLAIAEMLQSGTTCFSDMYYFPEITARLCQDIGIRGQIASPVFDAPSAWGAGADDYIAKGLALRDDTRHSELVSVVFGPHSTYVTGKNSLQRIAMLAAELDLPVHIHLHENMAEIEQAVASTGERPINLLDRLGLLGPKTQCVHMTTLNDDDLDLLQRSCASVIHCPQSNLKLANNFCPVTALHKRGINVALGTDSAASNNNLNLFLEMRMAAQMAKLHTMDASALPASKILEMATLGGARALGLASDIGSLIPGKAADMIAVDLSGPACQPVYTPISQLVYACNGSEVSHSWVNGKCLLQDRKLQTMNLPSVISAAQRWQARIATSE